MINIVIWYFYIDRTSEERALGVSDAIWSEPASRRRRSTKWALRTMAFLYDINIDAFIILSNI